MKVSRVFFLIPVIFVLSSCAATLEKRKEEADVHYKMGEVYFTQENYTGALEELSKAAAIYPDDPVSQHLLGLTYLAKRMYPEAAEHLGKAVSLNPRDSKAHVNLGVAYLELEKWDEAIVHFNEALGDMLYRTPEIARYNLGSAYYHKRDYEKAVDALKKAVSIDPQYAMAYNILGLSYDKLNMLDEAVEAYRKAVSIEPFLGDAYYNLGLALMRKKDRPEAKKAFGKVVELLPGSDRKAKSAREYIELLK
ncbi:MAG: tetratricopeptide repeat protein [Deltaproteobacteria bacterium]|nr:tetratricopeptide repeat protein [Deltaproteobacteria bacterium]